MVFKMPPIEKILEAYSAIADQRIEIKCLSAQVKSSDYSKEYTVTWDGNVYSSNDNASYWKGYVGYPIIAILMLQGRLPYNKEISGLFKGINWKKLNNKYNNNYSQVVEVLFNDWQQKEIDTQAIYAEMQLVYSKLKGMNLEGKRSSLRPPR